VRFPPACCAPQKSGPQRCLTHPDSTARGSSPISPLMLLQHLRKRLAAEARVIDPCLPSPAEKPPSGSNWIHEIKHDGFRLMARRDPVGIRLITRRGNDWTTRYPLVVEAASEPGHKAPTRTSIRNAGCRTEFSWVARG
jgi:hypothetical protein